MTFGDFSKIFITVLDKYFKSFFCLARKLSKKWFKIKKFRKRSKLQPQPRIKKKKIDNQTVPSGEEKLFNQMTEEELDKVIHDMVVSQFMFTRTLARALDGGQDQKTTWKVYNCWIHKGTWIFILKNQFCYCKILLRGKKIC